MISFSQQNRHFIRHTIQQHRRAILYSRALSQSQQKDPTSSAPSSPPSTVDGYSKKLSRVHMKSESNSIWDYAVNQFQKKPKPGTLIIIRHGESEWNQKRLFTGWCDTDLTEKGVKEMEHASRLLLERGYTFDVVYTSMLKRAVRSGWIVMNELNQIFRPVIKTWRLNERMYGALEGHSKPGLAKAFGADIVQRWRLGLLDRPPAMTEDHVYWHGRDSKYATLKYVPNSESLQDTIDRTIPIWNSHILHDLRAGRNVLIVGHRNSIRGILKHIDNLPMADVQKLSIPNGIPLVYKFDRDLQPITHREALEPLRGIWLEKAGLLQAAMDHEDHLASTIIGYVPTLQTTVDSRLLYQSSVSSSTSNNNIRNNKSSYSPSTINGIGSVSSDVLVKNLTMLEVSRKLYKDSTNHSEHDNEGISGVGCTELEESGNYLDIYLDQKILASQVMEKYKQLREKYKQHQQHVPSKINVMPLLDSYHKLNQFFYGYDCSCVTTDIKSDLLEQSKKRPQNDVLSRPLLVIIRHGKTEHNKLGLFTGWLDAALAPEGRAEAIKAGRLLKAHRINFDVVYTSWLSRAIETGLICLNELDTLWVPVTKTWRLNERMYGALTGLSKKMIRQIYGEAQFKKWRRGYDEPPPPISSFSSAYPGNDSRYVNFEDDIPLSFFETCIRTLAHGKIELHRAFPKTESLKDCMERTVPYFKNNILPVTQVGKNILISSSENAIRGLLMHLCDIPKDKIHSVEIPTGLPLVYDSSQRRIRLLQEETLDKVGGPERTPITSDECKHLIHKYDFGDRPELLFKILPVANHIVPLRDIRTTSIADGKTLDYRETVIPLLP